MGQVTGIEWCDHTWSPWRGCTKVSPGCQHCYAEAMSKRNPEILGEWGPKGKRAVNRDWQKPRRWDLAAFRARKRVRVFPSLCDPFEDRPDLVTLRAQFFGLIAATPRTDWLVLTKRPEEAASYFTRKMMWAAAEACRNIMYGPDSGVSTGDGLASWPPRNMWLGVSVEDRKHGLPRVDVLRAIPAAIRFLSVEPLLEALGTIDLTGIHWVIVGGESGSKARPFNLSWARSIRDQCKAAGVPVFVKQVGDLPYPSEWWDESQTPHVRRIIRGSKGGDPDEWPLDLRVREFPAATAGATS